MATAFVSVVPSRPHQRLPAHSSSFLSYAASSLSFLPVAAAQRGKTCDVRRFMSCVEMQAKGGTSVEEVLKSPKFPAEWPYSPGL